jgi:hypothetical protein
LEDARAETDEPILLMPGDQIDEVL